MTSSQSVYDSYTKIMVKYGHKQIPNVSIIPANDPTLLYVNSGMFPLVPYLSGEPHPKGTRLFNVQRALRFFEDIDNVGNTIRHTTLFHMIGNWSLGDYFKEQQLNQIYEFYVDELGLDPNRLFSTVFIGDEDAPRDNDSIKILIKIFKKYGIDAKVGERIFMYDKEDNWWQRGDRPGELGGPDSEIFYYLGEDDPKGKNPAEYQDEFLEIGNSVFIQYKMQDDLSWQEISQKNVDFGGGLERIALVVQGKTDIFETDSFYPIIQTLENITQRSYTESVTVKKAMRVLADHMRASIILSMDGISPSNKDQGYIMRRLIRRMARYARIFEIEEPIAPQLVSVTTNMLSWLYHDLPSMTKQIEDTMQEEENRFHATLKSARNDVKKRLNTTKSNEKDLAAAAFDLYQSMGYPSEIFCEDIEQHGIEIDKEIYEREFQKLFGEHQAQSRSGAEQKFKGGLADTEEQTVKYHTATHLLHQALNDVLGEAAQVQQCGSNITGERLRFDFVSQINPSKEQFNDIETIVNKIIHDGLPIHFEMMEKEKANEIGAKSFFKEKYPDVVKVYFIGGSIDDPKKSYSIEFCGGPHVKNTKDIGSISITRTKKIGTNMYRIYAE